MTRFDEIIYDAASRKELSRPMPTVQGPERPPKKPAQYLGLWMLVTVVLALVIVLVLMDKPLTDLAAVLTAMSGLVLAIATYRQGNQNKES